MYINQCWGELNNQNGAARIFHCLGPNTCYFYRQQLSFDYSQ